MVLFNRFFNRPGRRAPELRCQLIESLESRTLFAAAGLAAAYFDDINLSVTALGRVDAQVKFSWTGEPVPGVGNDFSVRWWGSVKARFTERYTFITSTTGGVRLWVNGQVLINNWTSHAQTLDAAAIDLTAGQKYEIRLEYFSTESTATARLYWESASQAREIIPKSQLYSNALESTPPTVATGLKALYVTDTAFQFRWNASTDPAGLLYDIYFGKTKVGTTSGTVYSRGGRKPNTAYGVTVKSVDAFGNTSASAPMIVTTSNPAPIGTGSGAAASYFSGDTFDQFKLTRTDASIDFTFGSPPVQSDSGAFSTRWRAKLLPKYSETYKFYLSADDGARLWINGKLLIDNWQTQGSETIASVALTAGKKIDLRVDFHSAASSGGAHLSWSSLSQAKQVIPAAQLFPAFVDSTAPSTATGLQVLGVSTTTATVSWTASTDDVGVASYDIYANARKVGSTSNTQFTATGLRASTQYKFQIVAIDGASHSSPLSSAVLAKTSGVSNRDAISGFGLSTYDGTSGVSTSGGNVTDFDSGDWVQFNNVDFSTGVNSVKLTLAVPTANIGGSVEMRLDSLAGPIIGTLVVQPTGSYSTYYTQQTAITGASGAHTLYLIGRNVADLANLQTIQFSTNSLTRVMTLGDSITQQFNGNTTWRYHLWQSLQSAGKGVDFVGSLIAASNGYPGNFNFDQNHEGHAGFRADQILASLPGWAASALPDVVLIHLGTNDLRQSQTPASTIDDLTSIINVLRSVNANVKIIVAQIIPAGDAPAGSVQSFNSLIPGMTSSLTTSQSPIVVVDQYTGFNLATDSSDNLHPNSSGEQKMAAKWLNALTPLLP